MSATNVTSKGVLAANLPMRRLKGLIRKPGKPVSIEEMNIAISACAGSPEEVNDSTRGTAPNLECPRLQTSF